MEKLDGVLNNVENEDLELLKTNPNEFWKGVKTIGNYAFFYLPIENIEIPDTITNVAAYAFANCNKLKEVKIGKNVKVLGADAFFNCKKLEKAYISGSVKEIGFSCFADCENLQEVILEDGIEFVNNFAFANCSKLKSIKFANSIKTIQEYCFQNCKSLEEVLMPESLTEIKNNLFLNCSNLKKVKLSPTTAKIGELSFSGCKNLQNINIENIRRIDAGAFDGCENISKFEISKNNFFIHESCINHSLFNYVFQSKQKNNIILLKDLPKNSEQKVYELSKFKNVIENFDNRIFLLPNFNIDKFSFFLENAKKQGISFPYKFLYDIKKNNIVTDFNELNFKFLLKELPEFKDILNYDYYDEKINFLNFANALGCFSNLNFMDKNGNILQTTFAQKASSLLAYMINKDIVSMVDLFENFKECLHVKPNQAFLEFLTTQGKNKTLPNLNMLIKLNEEYPGIFVMVMSDFNKLSKARNSVDEKGLPKKLSWEETFKKAYKQTPYNGVIQETEDIAKLFHEHNLTQEQFETATSLRMQAKSNNVEKHILKKPLKQKTFLQEVEDIAKQTNEKLLEIKNRLENIFKREFTFEMLDKYDPRNLIIGIYTSCCATITGDYYGKDIAKASIIAHDVQNLVVKDSSNEIIAKAAMYVNKKHGYIVINGFEMNKRYRLCEAVEAGYYNASKDDKREIEREQIFGAFMNGLHSFIREYDKRNPENPIKQVNVGMGYNRLKSQCERFKGAFDFEMLEVPTEYSFDDVLAEQRILYKRPKSKNIKSEINKNNDIEFN